MSSIPVGLFTLGTAQELIVILVNILWNKVPCILSCDTIERLITPGTAGEGIKERFKGQGGKDLFDLLLYEVAFDEQMVHSQGPITKCPVPRQNHAVLFQ